MIANAPMIARIHALHENRAACALLSGVLSERAT
jgi:hypothetical protein